MNEITELQKLAQVQMNDLATIFDATDLLLKFGLNLLFQLLISYGIYFQRFGKREFSFSYISISSIVFLLCYLLQHVQMEMGFALGLFAIFGIVRYRTDQVPIREMTYLFVAIGLAVVNAFSAEKIGFSGQFLVDGIILITLLLLEFGADRFHLKTCNVLFERIDLLHESKKKELNLELTNRIGYEVKNISIGQINYLNDTAELKVQYNSKKPKPIKHEELV